MQKLRSSIALQLGKGKFHPQLVCNYDQVWSLLYTPRKKNLVIRKAMDPLAKSRSLRAIRHCLERALHLPFTEPMGQEIEGPQEPRIVGGAAASSTVDQWRVPRTLTTLSWRDGRVGRGFLTIKDEYLTESQRQEANQAGFQNMGRIVPPKSGCSYGYGPLNPFYIYIYIYYVEPSITHHIRLY